MVEEDTIEFEGFEDTSRKLRELVLLIAIRSEGDRPFGAVKLNKLLFYADFLAYFKFGASITGEEYQALPQGPAPRRLKPVLRDMEDRLDIAIRENDYYGKHQHRVLAKRSPNTKLFTYEEIELVEDTINTFWGRNAREISDTSHKFAGWRLASIGETIPYPVALIGEREPTQAEYKYGLTLVDLANRYCPE
jgi:hypothetical protein